MRVAGGRGEGAGGALRRERVETGKNREGNRGKLCVCAPRREKRDKGVGVGRGLPPVHPLIYRVSVTVLNHFYDLNPVYNQCIYI